MNMDWQRVYILPCENVQCAVLNTGQCVLCAEIVHFSLYFLLLNEKSLDYFRVYVCVCLRACLCVCVVIPVCVHNLCNQFGGSYMGPNAL